MQVSVFLLLFILNSAWCQFFVPEDEDSGVRAESCHLPTGKPALCLPLENCKYIQALIGNLQKPLPPDVALLIRDSFFCTNRHAPESLNVCCPIEGIEPPTEDKPLVRDLGRCVLASAGSSSCAAFSTCSPFTQLLRNLRRPFPPEIPKLMRGSWVCGRTENNLPKVCCPDEAIIKESATTTTVSTTTTTVSTTTTPAPETDSLRFANHPHRSGLAAADNCGFSFISQRIVGGKNAKIGQYPWLVNIGYTSTRRSGILFNCGGTLIGDQYVVTAAHCVTRLPKSFSVAMIRVGEHDLSSKEDCVVDGNIKDCSDPPQNIEIEKIIPHPEYGVAPFNRHDIALIKLAKAYEPNDFVSAICMPFSDSANETYQSASQVTVAGWGATTKRATKPASILQYLDIGVFDYDKCVEVYKMRKTELMENFQFCAGGVQGEDSCAGDSGSALMSEKETLHTIIGVVSFGPRLCGTPDVPGVYTRVREYVDWILDNVEVPKSSS